MYYTCIIFCRCKTITMLNFWKKPKPTIICDILLIASSYKQAHSLKHFFCYSVPVHHKGTPGHCWKSSSLKRHTWHWSDDDPSMTREGAISWCQLEFFFRRCSNRNTPFTLIGIRMLNKHVMVSCNVHINRFLCTFVVQGKGYSIYTNT